MGESTDSNYGGSSNNNGGGNNNNSRSNYQPAQGGGQQGSGGGGSRQQNSRWSGFKSDDGRGGGGGGGRRDDNRGGGGGRRDDRGGGNRGGGGRGGGGRSNKNNRGFHGRIGRNERSEQSLFGDVQNTGINFDKYDDIPVEVGGENCPDPITDYNPEVLGEELALACQLSGFQKPTPVQKYASKWSGQKDRVKTWQGFWRPRVLLLAIVHCLMLLFFFVATVLCLP